MTIEEKAEKIKSFIEDKEINCSISNMDLEIEQYNHMGARIVECVLLDGRPYPYEDLKTRIDLLKCLENKEKVSDFKKFYKQNDLIEVLNIRKKDEGCINIIKKVTELFIEKGLETKKDLIKLLEDNENILEEEGIKHRMSQYLKKSLGIPVIIISIIIQNFLKHVGIDYNDDKEAEEILKGTANMLGIKEHVLDSSIWKYSREHIKKGKINLPKPFVIWILGEVDDKNQIKTKLNDFFIKNDMKISDWDLKIIDDKKLKNGNDLKALK